MDEIRNKASKRSTEYAPFPCTISDRWRDEPNASNTASQANNQSDGFTILIPINTANAGAPIAVDENPDDPHWKFYRSLWFFVQQGQQLSTEEERADFVRRLGQMYVFQSLFSMSRQSYGGRNSAEGERPQ